MLGLALLLANGCAGAGRATPTALPPDVARPDQPAPVFNNPAQDFRLTPPPVPTRAPAVPSAPAVPLPERPTVVAPLIQTPTALAVAITPAALAASPYGPTIRELPAGTTLTITGRNADAAWLAAYTEDGVAGWVAASTVALFGADDLTVVDAAVAPNAIATLIATAMLPVVLPPAATATPRTGVVLPAEGLAILPSPQPGATPVGRAAGGQTVQVLGRSPDGGWLVVVADRTLGWVPVSALRLDAGADPLPVIRP
jgi:hypothetical protein